MCFAEFKGFAQLCLCRRVRIRNFVFPALVTAFSPRALLGFGVFKLRRGLVRKVPSYSCATRSRLYDLRFSIQNKVRLKKKNEKFEPEREFNF